jgi:Leucine-rich repeat (LRR) protein
MSYNRLSQLQQGDFDGAVNLESIYLNNNLIEHISLSTFFNLSKIVEFNIGNNPISALYNLTLSYGVLTSKFIG